MLGCIINGVPSQTKTVRNEGTLVSRYSVLVDVQVNLIADKLHSSAVNTLLAKVNHEEMVVSTSRHNVVAKLLQLFDHRQ